MEDTNSSIAPYARARPGPPSILLRLTPGEDHPYRWPGPPLWSSASTWTHNPRGTGISFRQFQPGGRLLCFLPSSFSSRVTETPPPSTEGAGLTLSPTLEPTFSGVTAQPGTSWPKFLPKTQWFLSGRFWLLIHHPKAVKFLSPFLSSSADSLRTQYNL